ncbi:hypothetical protein FGG08_005750 [Glutinoglossum americanum]|uniref:N-acetyltransferase domain-containing protein n=1 Tax=Glutinoglossum americanum TaxID=1670608 RepID=A0A9P8KY68_9PEZI|nr:hypothetical protein FGG08_005750 [Glutinoglossum americanum]
MSPPLPLRPTLRPAQPRDIPAITTLILTSFRHFPLFDFLYAPLRDNVEYARDTVFFWSRRVRAAVYDRASTVVVAEVPLGSLGLAGEGQEEGEGAVSWRMLAWTEGEAGLSQVVDGGGGGAGGASMVVVGFAIWRWKGKGALAPRDTTTHSAAYTATLHRAKKIFTELETRVYGKIQARKDQHARRYAAYLESEKELAQKPYKLTPPPYLHLDNLCVDFRLHRRGIGRLLVEQGIALAQAAWLPIQTEASPAGAAFYHKLGFQQLDEWIVPDPDPDPDPGPGPDPDPGQGPGHGHGVRLVVLKLDTDTVSNA